MAKVPLKLVNSPTMGHWSTHLNTVKASKSSQMVMHIKDNTKTTDSMVLGPIHGNMVRQHMKVVLKMV
jgi:hypothetical protein